MALRRLLTGVAFDNAALLAALMIYADMAGSVESRLIILSAETSGSSINSWILIAMSGKVGKSSRWASSDSCISATIACSVFAEGQADILVLLVDSYHTKRSDSYSVRLEQPAA